MNNMKRKIKEVSDQNDSGGCQKRKNPKANENAMYCNRRTRDKLRLNEWITNLQLVEIDPRLKIVRIKKKESIHRSKVGFLLCIGYSTVQKHHTKNRMA